MDFDQIQLKSEFASMRRKLAKVEAQNRRLRLAGIAILAAGMVAGAWLVKILARESRVVEAERFVVRDRQGRVVAELSGSDAGSELALYGFVGKARLVVDPERAMLVLDGRGQRSIYSAPE